MSEDDSTEKGKFNDDEKGMELIDNMNEENEIPQKKAPFSEFGFGQKEKYNQTMNFNQQNQLHNQIAKNLEQNDSDDENNDADPEDLMPKSPNEMNKTLDDIFTAQMFGIRDPNEKIVPFDSRKAGMFERMLHPIQYGSLRGSIFALSSMCLDTGTLVLATKCKDFGLVPFLAAVIIGGCLANWSLNMMIRAARNIKERDYSKVVKVSLGKKVGVFLDCNITLYLFGVLISFQVIIFSLIASLAYDFFKIFANEEEAGKYKNFEEYKDGNFSNSWPKRIGITFLVVALALPLCLLKDVSKMRWASLIGVLALAYSILVIVIESPFFYFSESPKKSINWFDIREAFYYKNHITFFSCIATVFFIYSCHAGAFPVYKTLRNNTTRRIKKVFRRSILLDMVIYFSVALASYITEPENPPSLILFRENLKSFKTDYFIMLAKVGIIFNLFFSTPPNYAALRISVFELIWGNTNITTLKNIIVTVILMFTIGTVAIVYPEILPYISLLGGFCSVIYCYLIPGLIYVKNNKLPWKAKSNLLVIGVVVLLTILGYTAGIFTILFDMVKIAG